jgi:YVTN family beta-propeller protein
MRKKYWFIGIVVVLGLLIYFPGRKLARQHVNYMTAAEGHSLLCYKCHAYTSDNSLIRNILDEDYNSPFNLVVSTDGNRLYVVAQDANELLVVDPIAHEVLNSILVGNKPHSVILDKNEQNAYVSNQWANFVSVIDLKTFQVTDSLKTGNGPAGLSLSADEKTLYVVNTFSSDISVIDLKTKNEQKRLSAGSDPTGIKLSPNGQLYVTSRRAKIVPYGEPVVCDLTVINDSAKRVDEYKEVESAYMMENVAFTPSGDLGVVTLIRPKNLVPTIQVEHGWIMTHGIGIIDMKNEGRIIQLLLDEPGAYYSDPFDVAITPDGKKAFVTSSGVNSVSVIDLDSVRSLIASSTPEMLNSYANHLGISSKYIVKRIKTGANPKGLAVSPDGKLLYIAEQLEDRIAVVNVENLETISSIVVGNTDVSINRKGRRLFTNAGGTYQNQFACYTCHPDNHEDGLVYNMAASDMGRNLANTQSLREINHTAPFKWNGKNQTVYKQDGMRFSTVLTRNEGFSFDQLDAITAFILTGIKSPPNLQYNNNGELTASQERGKIMFERSIDNDGKPIPEKDRCVTCHPPPYFSNFQFADVGTLAENDDPTDFDTPHLNNVFTSAPYLHDGRAATLEEIWTKYAHHDEHGRVNDMLKGQLNDLIDYLKSIGSASMYSAEKSKGGKAADLKPY